MNWQRFWQQRGIGNIILLPLSGLFYLISTARRQLYRLGILKTHQADLPVVVIGNLNVGGAGKTPLVIALGKLLAENNIKYAVISKGYGGSYTTPTIVTAEHTAHVVGDEPLLIKLKCDCPVVVAQSRYEATKIIAQQFPDTQIILTDDGLQHYQLHRDVNVCVINHRIGLGNGWVLPAGGLREPPSRLQDMHYVVSNGDTTIDYHYVLSDRDWYPINQTPSPDNKRYHDEFEGDQQTQLALSGIAHPQLFFDEIATFGIDCQTRALPDHYAISEDDLPADKTLLMTEKDWVKAKQFEHDDAWYLCVEAVLSTPLKTDFIKTVKSLL